MSRLFRRFGFHSERRDTGGKAPNHRGEHDPERELRHETDIEPGGESAHLRNALRRWYVVMSPPATENRDEHHERDRDTGRERVGEKGAKKLGPGDALEGYTDAGAHEHS